MSFAALLNQTCTIKRPAFTQSANGSEVRTESTLATDVACRVSPLSASERVVAGKDSLIATHTVFLPAGTDVAETDIIESGGVRLRCLAVTDVRAFNAQHHIEVLTLLLQ